MPHNISHVAPTHNNIRLPMCVSLPDADTQRRTTGIKIGAISRTSPTNYLRWPLGQVCSCFKCVRAYACRSTGSTLHMEWYVQSGFYKCMLPRGTPTCHSE